MPARGWLVASRSRGASQLADGRTYETSGGGAPRAKGGPGGTSRGRRQRESRGVSGRGHGRAAGVEAGRAMGGFTRDPPTTTGAKRGCDSETGDLRGQRR